MLQELNVLPPTQVPIDCVDSQVHQDLNNVATSTEADIHLSCDNQGTVKLAQNLVFHAKIKHIEAKHHFIRVHVLEGEITLDYIHTKNNPCDLLTKSLPNFTFE